MGLLNTPRLARNERQGLLSPLEIQLDNMANNPLRPNLSSKMMQQDLINKGLMAIGMAPLGMAKYFHGGVPYKQAHSANHNPRDFMGYLGSWWTPSKELAENFGPKGKFASRGENTGNVVSAEIKGKYLGMDSPFWKKHGFRENNNAIDNEFDVLESYLLGTSMAKLAKVPVMKWIDIPSAERMKIAKDTLQSQGYAGLTLRDAKVDRGMPQKVVFDIANIVE